MVIFVPGNGFTPNENDLAKLMAAVKGAGGVVGIYAINGMAGVGKRNHASLRAAAVGDENWVPSAGWRVRAGAGWGFAVVRVAVAGAEGAQWWRRAACRHCSRLNRSRP